MSNNLHPLFVHFPIALFTVFALLEMIPSKRLRENHTFFLIKFFILFVGFIAVWPTLMSGEAVEHMFAATSENGKIVTIHSMWASISVFFFGVLAIAYLVEWFRQYEERIMQHQSPFGRAYGRLRGFVTKTYFIDKFWALIMRIQSKIFSTPVLVILAFLGLLSLTVTGALGAFLVHGAGVDPIVNLFYKLHKPLLNSSFFGQYLVD